MPDPALVPAIELDHASALPPSPHINGVHSSHADDVNLTAAGVASTQFEAPSPTLEQERDLWSRIRAQFALRDMTHPRMQAELAWFTRNQDYLDRVADRARLYLHHVVEEVEKRNLPMELALLPVVESGFQPFAYSPARASGLWQFVPATGRVYGLKLNWWYDGRRDVLASTRAALDYLEKLNAEFNDDWLLAIAAYNSGEGNVQRAIRRNRRAGKPVDFWSLRLPRETRTYVPRLLAVAAIVQDPEKHGLRLKAIPDKPYFEQVDLDGQIDLALAADLAGLSLEDLYLLNPGFNRWATDPSGPHYLLLPKAKTEEFKRRIAELPPERRVQWHRHRIRQGDTLGGIAHRYRTTVAVLRQINRLRGNTIRAGRSLIVPVAARAPREYTLSADARRAASVQKGPAGATKVTYTVRKGDNLWAIARRHRVSLHKLTAWNGLARHDLLQPGQKITIWDRTSQGSGSPPKLTADAVLTRKTNRRIRYTVRHGDSLWRISRRFKVSIASLREWNSLSPGVYLQPGQRLDLYIDVRHQSES